MFDKLPEAYRRQFAIFLTAPYEKRCFKDSMSFHALCESNREKIAALFAYAEKNHLRIGYWGVGRMTEGFVWAAACLGKGIDYFVDNNKEKTGKSLFGKEIVTYDSIKDQAGLMIISNKQYYSEIFRQIKEGKKEMQVLSVQEYLYCDGAVEQYIR